MWHELVNGKRPRERHPCELHLCADEPADTDGAVNINVRLMKSATVELCGAQDHHPHLLVQALFPESFQPFWCLPHTAHYHRQNGYGSEDVVRVHVCEEDARDVDHAQGRLVEAHVGAVSGIKDCISLAILLFVVMISMTLTPNVVSKVDGEGPAIAARHRTAPLMLVLDAIQAIAEPYRCMFPAAKSAHARRDLVLWSWLTKWTVTGFGAFTTLPRWVGAECICSS